MRMPEPRRLGLPGSTVGAALRRLGLCRLAALDPRPPVVRYERDNPGERIHLDIKKLGRIDGTGHRRALAWFERHGVRTERVITDNGSACTSCAFRDLLAEHGVCHKRTRPYTPRTNGKAERFIQASLREWAYARPFTTSAERAAAMQPWLCNHNRTRPRSARGEKPPISRLATGKLHGNDSSAAWTRLIHCRIAVRRMKPRKLVAA